VTWSHMRRDRARLPSLCNCWSLYRRVQRCQRCDAGSGLRQCVFFKASSDPGSSATTRSRATTRSDHTQRPIQIHTHTHIYTHIYIHIYICIHTYIYIYTYTYHTHIHTYIHTHLRTSLYAPWTGRAVTWSQTLETHFGKVQISTRSSTRSTPTKLLLNRFVGGGRAESIVQLSGSVMRRILFMAWSAADSSATTLRYTHVGLYILLYIYYVYICIYRYAYICKYTQIQRYQNS
jgi:hypothetical protein